MVILNLSIKSIAPSPSNPGLGDVQCPGVSTGWESGHLGSSSRSPPDSRITLVMSASLDLRLPSVTQQDWPMWRVCTCSPPIFMVTDIFLNAYYASGISGCKFLWKGLSI